MLRHAGGHSKSCDRIKASRRQRALRPLRQELVDVTMHMAVKAVWSEATKMIELKKTFASLATTLDDDGFEFIQSHRRFAGLVHSERCRSGDDKEIEAPRMRTLTMHSLLLGHCRYTY